MLFKRIFNSLVIGLLLLASGAHAVESTGTVTTATAYTTTTTEFPNPERGYYGSAAYVNPYFYLKDVTASNAADVFSKGIRLAIQVLYLGDYRTTQTLPQSFLDSTTAQLAILRSAGLKVILRPGYNYDQGGADPTLAIGLSHIQQLAPIFKANADIIPFLEAGSIGAFAEWHDSTTMCVDMSPSASCRLQLITTELASTDVNTQILVRYPRYIINWFPTALNSSSRYSGSSQSRVGSHNDCFMSDNTDVGTYQSSNLTQSNPERARVANDSQWTGFGGETCGGFSPARMACSDILAEGPLNHLTFLNKNYYQAFFDSWTSGGCIDQVARSIGYRFQIDSFSHQGTATATQSVTFNLGMRNQGWSRIHSARRPVIQLVSSGGATALTCTGSQSLRTLAPTATSSTALQIKCTIPAGFTAGTYSTYLAIPDIYPTTAANRNFAVRPANQDNTGAGQSWDSTNGRFKMGTTITTN